MIRAAVVACVLAACAPAAGMVQAPTTTALERRPEALPVVDAQAPEKAPTEEDAPIPIMHDDPWRGSRFAAVTMVEFADFQCPYCGRVEETLAKLRERYGDEGLRLVWKNDPLPFHPRARPAAEAAVGVFLVAGNDAFWSFHDAAFKNQRSLDEASLEEWAEAAGVAADTLREGLEHHAWAPKIDDDVKLAERLQAAGTPHFFVNGVRLVGAQSLDKFEALIDDEAKKANDRMAEGASRARIYVTMTRANYQGMRDNVVLF
jgi:protein-disulfide isomerase